jgi:formate dehydrogenase subunit gamma
MSPPTSPPASPEAGSDRSALVRAVAEHHRDQRGPLLPVLHEVMAEFGYVDPADVPVIADVLNLSSAEVYGVVSFYHDFRTSPPPTHVLALCRAEACQAVGAEDLYAETRGRAAAGALGDAEVQQVFCLGNCALGPSGMVDGRLHGRLDAERLDALTQGWRG